MQENAELATIANVQCSDVEELIETIINLTSPDSDHRESFYTIYAHGGCDVFAVALQRIIGSDLYAVTDPIDEKGKRVRLPHLVHAGAYDGDDVIDIESRSPRDTKTEGKTSTHQSLTYTGHTASRWRHRTPSSRS